MNAFVVTDAHIRTASRTVVLGDLHVVGEQLAAGPPPPGAEVIRAGGAHVVPLLVDSAVAQLPPARRGQYELVPGNPATFAVVRRPVSESQVRTMLIVDPRDLLAVYVAGHLEAWDGEPTRPAGQDLESMAVRETWVGTWEDPRRAMQQHLRPDGRYSETRSGRVDAYTGRYWVNGSRITYLDDSGFWAFGQLVDDVLHHAGFVLPGCTRSWLSPVASAYGRGVPTSDLGPFLKARRSHIQPESVGMATHTTRRVPGLRREEVAMLAGVSVDYYARLEQGRERNPSPSVLNAIASALRLDPHQREHLFRLADLAPAPLAPLSVALPQSLTNLLEAWPGTPAIVINRQLDVLAHNALAGALYADFARIDNLARMTFLDPVGAHFYAHWDRAAESCVANLRLALGHVDSADAVLRLVVELSEASAAFRQLWARHDVRGKTHDSKAFRHRDVGDLVLDYHAFDVLGSPGCQLVVYQAVPGSPSAEKVQLLASLHATQKGRHGAAGVDRANAGDPRTSAT